MSRINLSLSMMPYEVAGFVRLKEQSGEFILKAAFIDTGADKSLFPLSLLDSLEHTIVEGDIEIEQAGIAQQYFKATEAKITLYFEDGQGNFSSQIEARAWFGNTDEILEQATLFVDYRKTRTGWLEFD